MTKYIKLIEKEAQQLFDEQKYQEASDLFSQAATYYQGLSQHQQAAFMFASAAGCLSLKAGEKAAFYYAATVYEKGAHEAEIAADFEYASMLYKHAGTCYERDLGFSDFAECFYRSKECYRKYLGSTLFPWQMVRSKSEAKLKFNFIELNKRFVAWFSLAFSSVLWGHGERPQRTLILAAFVVLASASLYMQGQMIKDNIICKPNLLDAVYFSILNFTRVGYWDIKPIGFNKGLAALESIISGIFIIPIFITGLCRKYLRFI